jgi:hypothetical protein
MMPPFDTSIMSRQAMFTPLPPTDAERLMHKRLRRARNERLRSALAYITRALHHKGSKATVSGT